MSTAHALPDEVPRQLSLVPAARATAATVAPLIKSAQSYVAAAKSARTRAAYRSNWQAFDGWCARHGLNSLPAAPETVALYLAARADEGRKVATIQLALAAIAEAHRAAGQPSPRESAVVRGCMSGIRRTLGVAQTQKAPLLAEDLRAIAPRLPGTAKGVRDRALLLLGFAGAFRRSELVGLDVEHLEWTGDELIVRLARSKTDQEGSGRAIGIPKGSDPSTCPVRALQAWLRFTGAAAGPIFVGVTRAGRTTGHRLDGHDVATIVKAAVTRIGLDPDRYSGHSLRAGLATTAAKAGKSERAIMAQTGHRSVAMLRRYIRDAEALGTDNAARGLL